MKFGEVPVAPPILTGGKQKTSSCHFGGENLGPEPDSARCGNLLKSIVFN